MSEKKQIIWAAIFGATSIMLGALGAHFLKEILTKQELNSFLTGVRYQMYSALFLLMLALLQEKLKVKIASNLAIVGTLFFSGSIYLLVADSYLGIKLSVLGALTPIGGILLITSWVFVAIAAFREKS